MLPAGRADLVESFSYPLPITVICELLGVPEMDRTEFRELSMEAVAPTDADSGYDAIVRLAQYLRDLIEDKRCAGHSGDLLSDLIRTTAEDGDRLSPQELRGMAFILLIAGHETTVNLLTSGVHALLTHPDQLAALRADMTLLDGAIEEMLRYEGPVENATFRFAAEPLDVAGTFIEKGESVRVCLNAADRDAGRFPPRTASTSAATPAATSPSATASTTASAPPWPASKHARRYAPCWSAPPPSPWTARPATGSRAC
jgi:cytochrome P450